MGRKLPLLRRGGALRVVIVLPPREDEPRQLLTMSLSEPTESESKRGKSSQGSYWTTTLRGRTMSTSDNVFLWEWLLYNHIDGWNHIDIRQCLSLNHKVNHKKVQRVVIAQLCWPTTMYFSEPKESESRSMWKLTWRGGTASNKCFSEPKANGQKVIKHHHRQFKTHTHNHHRHWLKFVELWQGKQDLLNGNLPWKLKEKSERELPLERSCWKEALQWFAVGIIRARTIKSDASFWFPWALKREGGAKIYPAVKGSENKRIAGKISWKNFVGNISWVWCCRFFPLLLWIV